MSASRQLRMLTRYTAWANTRLFAALWALPPGERQAPRATAFGNMVNTLNHAFVVDAIWRAHLEGKSHGYTSRITEAEPDLATLEAAQRAMDQWYVTYADQLPEEKLREVLQFKFVDGGPGAMARADMLLHIVNHKTFHRGYVADTLYQAGSRPPVMDLPVFLRDAPPDL